MEGELYNFTKVWLTVLVSLSYCYFIEKITPKGPTRLLCVLPIISLFLLLPLKLSSIHLGGYTAFFIAWLADFKLLLFAFDKGPLSSSQQPPLSLPRFVATACLPIKVQVDQNPRKNPHKSASNYAVKCLLLVTLIHVVYNYGDYLHQKVILILYGFHLFFMLDLVLAAIAALVRALLGVELEPQFDEPYLSTSLQDFWGRRWNTVVTRILHPTVYEPVLGFFSRAIGRKWAPLPAVFATFVVSAVMHELIFYYLGRMRPTWEISWFFIFHGMCLMVEIILKKTLTTVKWRFPRLIRRILTVGIVMVTGFWWFFPQLLRCKADVRAFEEYVALGTLLKDIGHGVSHFNFFSSNLFSSK